jgi:hypothetical protein
VGWVGLGEPKRGAYCEDLALRFVAGIRCGLHDSTIADELCNTSDLRKIKCEGGARTRSTVHLAS